MNRIDHVGKHPSVCRHDELIADYNRGERVCMKCGLVVREQLLNRGPEWRAFTKEERNKRTRTGAPQTHSSHDKGLSTVISLTDRDASGRRIPAAQRLKMMRLRKWHYRTHAGSSRERNLSQAMAELDGLVDRIHLPASTKENAAVIYRRALRQDLVRGRSIAAIVAASLYAACRQLEIPRTLREVAAASKIRKKNIARCYRLLLRHLEIQMPTVDPVHYVPRIASIANIPQRDQNRAIEIISMAKDLEVHIGKHPKGLAAAALYMACLEDDDYEMTQKELAQAASITEMTVRNRYKGLKRKLRLVAAMD